MLAQLWALGTQKETRLKPVERLKTKRLKTLRESNVQTMWTSNQVLEINPPCWESALHFLDTFTYMDSEFGVIDLVTTGMFDLSHPETAAQLDLVKSLRAIRQKSSIAKDIVKWIADNKDLLDDYPDALRCAGNPASHQQTMIWAEKI